MINRLSLFLVVLMFAGVARAQVGQAYAVIVVGEPGMPMYTRHYADRSARFAKVLESAGVSGDRLTVVPSTSTAEAVNEAIKTAVAKPTAADQFILILIGHGEMKETGPTFMVTGPDLPVKAISDQLKSLKAKSQIVLNFTSTSGDSLALFAQKGRVNITSTSLQQVNDTDLAEFFLQELEKKDGSKSLLDVYNRSTQAWGRWVVRQKTNPPAPEGSPPAPLGWMVEGRESTAIFKKLYGYDDVPENRKFLPSPLSEQPDAADPMLAVDGSAFWAQRRVISESPIIDDAAATEPVSALGEKGFAAVVASPQAGAIAAVTVLGKAEPVAPTKPQAVPAKKPATKPASQPATVPVE